MKNFKILILFLTMSLFSCSDNSNEPIADESITTNNWTLVAATGSMVSIYHEFPRGTIIWKFNSNNTLTIINNTTDSSLQSGFASGTYTYSISDNDENATCKKQIRIATAEFQCLVVSGTQMSIDQRAVDGNMYQFEKITSPENQ